MSEIKRELEMGLRDGYIARILALHHQVISHLQMEKELVTERDGERDRERWERVLPQWEKSCGCFN